MKYDSADASFSILIYFTMGFAMALVFHFAFESEWAALAGCLFTGIMMACWFIFYHIVIERRSV